MDISDLIKRPPVDVGLLMESLARQSLIMNAKLKCNNVDKEKF